MRILFIADERMVEKAFGKGAVKRLTGDTKSRKRSRPADEPGLLLLGLMPAADPSGLARHLQALAHLPEPAGKARASEHAGTTGNHRRIARGGSAQPLLTVPDLAAGAPVASATREEPSRTPVTCHGITIDPIRHRVFAQGKPLDLSPAEYRLLECFLRQPGVALSRQTLGAALSPSRQSASSRNVDTYVKLLRKKLRDPTLFEAIRGLGYRLREESAEEASAPTVAIEG